MSGAEAGRGPAALGVHMAAIAAMWNAALAAAGPARAGFAPWHPAVRDRAEAVVADLAGVSPGDLALALTREIAARADAFAAGVAAYRASPVRRGPDRRPVIWRRGTTRLRGPLAGDTASVQARPPVLVVPSLINRWHILDLEPGQGLLSRIEDRGLAPYVVDFGAPGPAEAGFDAEAYVARRLAPAFDAVAERHGGAPVAVLGHCLGGTLALGLAAMRAPRLSALALLAAPWDFTALAGPMTRWAAVAGAHAPAALGTGTETVMPAERVALLMALADTGSIEAKYRRFASLEPGGAEARRFVLVEDWANDAVAMARPLAAQVFGRWIAGEGPAQGAFAPEGRPVDPRALPVDTLLVLAARDRLVPPAAGEGLAALLPRARRLDPQGGHVGMVVGHDAETRLIGPLADWLAGHAPTRPKTRRRRA